MARIPENWALKWVLALLEIFLVIIIFPYPWHVEETMPTQFGEYRKFEAQELEAPGGGDGAW